MRSPRSRWEDDFDWEEGPGLLRWHGCLERGKVMLRAGRVRELDPVCFQGVQFEAVGLDGGLQDFMFFFLRIFWGRLVFFLGGPLVFWGPKKLENCSFSGLQTGKN